MVEVAVSEQTITALGGIERSGPKRTEVSNDIPEALHSASTDARHVDQRRWQSMARPDHWPPGMTSAQSTDYRLLPRSPAVEDYRRLRGGAGLQAKTEAPATGAVAGSWAFCHVAHAHARVAMGRAIGDGGWVVAWLLEEIRDRAPDGAYVSITPSPSGSKLFEQLGFRPPIVAGTHQDPSVPCARNATGGRSR